MRAVLLSIALLGLAAPARAEAPPVTVPPVGAAPAEAPHPASPAPPRDGVAFGFTVHRFQDDFAVGGLVASPSFALDTMRIVGGGGVAWFPHGRDDAGNETWVRYGHGRLVLEGGAKLRGAPMRLYGFGGAMVVVPPSSLSDTGGFLGGVGGFGFELRFRQPEGDGPVTYFLELGGVGIGASANKLPAHPIFANGFLTTAGLRIYPF